MNAAAAPSGGGKTESSLARRPPLVRVRTAVLAALVLAAIFVGVVGEETARADATPGTWTVANRMGTERLGHTVTRLHWPDCEEPFPPVPCERVLVAGGRDSVDGAPLKSTELYDAVAQAWEGTSDLVTARSDHTATLLADGRVLVVGGKDRAGKPVATAELFEPLSVRQVARCDPNASPPKPCKVQGVWAPMGQLTAARWGHAATLLPDGRVLVTGGVGESGEPVADVEVFDPASDPVAPWTAAPAMNSPRWGHTATVVGAEGCGPSPAPRGCGKVLVAGGTDESGRAQATSQVFDPSGGAGTGTWEPAATMGAGRSSHAAVALRDGTVLVAGGVDESDLVHRSAEVFDPSAQPAGQWNLTAPMGSPRAGFTMTRLDGHACGASRTCGQVLVAGGSGRSGPELASAELFDPEARTWRATGSLLTPRAAHAAALLATGQVLVAGGASGDRSMRSVEVFDPASFLQPPSVSALTPTGAPLGGGNVVITGAGFTGVTLVRFGDVPADVLAVEDFGTRVRVVAPSQPAGTVRVTVTTPVGTSFPTDTARFTYAPPPTVTAIKPIAGSSDGGTEVTITGTHLGFDDASVEFGGVPAKMVQVVSTTELVAVSPPHAPGHVHIIVRTPAGVSPPSFATRFAYGAGTWSRTGPLDQARYHHSATLLADDGKVLVAGGTAEYLGAGPTRDSAEIYDPERRRWEVTGSLNVARFSHTATLLDGPKCRTEAMTKPSYCGQVLVAGGQRQDQPGDLERHAPMLTPLGSSELFNPGTGAWSLTEGQPLEARFSHTATLLDGPECQVAPSPAHCGKVLVAGGSLDEQGRLPLDSAELYDPETETWATTGPLDEGCTPSSARFCGRTNHTATLLPDGRVLVTGGIGSDEAGRPPANITTVTNAAELTITGPDGAPASVSPVRSATVSHTIARRLDGAFPLLGVLLSADPDESQMVAPGSTLTYSLAYFNVGTGPAKDAVMVASLPEVVEFVTAQGPGYDYDQATHSVRFPPVPVATRTTGQDPAGSFRVTVRVKPTAEEGTRVVSRAQMDSALSNSVSHDVGMSAPPGDVGLVLTADPGSGSTVRNGDRLTYSLSYFNAGATTVTATMTIGPLPELLRAPFVTLDGRPLACRPEAATAACFEPDDRTLTISSVPIPGGTSRERPGGVIELKATAFSQVNNPPPVFLSTAELYDPVEGQWAAAKPLVIPRFGHTATLLATPPCGEHCGKVLVVGGAERLAPDRPVFVDSAELYDPTSGARSAHAMREPRAGHTATLLPDGQVLVAGSSMVFPHQGLPDRLASAELFDPLRTKWRDTAPMAAPRGNHTATFLDSPACGSEPAADYCGTVLVAGGAGPDATPNGVAPLAVADAEQYRQGLGAPLVVNVTPTEGPSAGGGEVTIAGGGFNKVSAVSFGGIRVERFTVHSPARITAVAPRHPAGTVDVTVAAGGGMSSPTPGSRFTYKVSQPPGGVTDLTARVVSGSEVELAFSAPPSDGSFPPPAERYVVKQAAAPIVGEAAFAAATTLCPAECRFSPRAVGDKLSLAVADLAPGTEYYYALRAVNEIGQVGPISNSVSATMPSRVSAAAAVEAPTTSTAPPPPPEAETVEGEVAAAAPRTGPAKAGGPPSPAARQPGPPAGPIAPVPAPGTSPGTERDESRRSPLPDPLPPVGVPQATTGTSTWRTALLWGLGLVLIGTLGAYLNRRYRPPLPNPRAAREGPDR